ncbi:MAG: hypothetical protein LBI42_10120 [Chitinispirillales bacterium]|jgi:hypothetical protein|nr:hypothetical protein [Chitinispirillales bacterium]
MILELGGYGLICGFLAKADIPVIFKLLIGQIGGRVIRAAAVLIAVFLFNNTMSPNTVLSAAVIGLPGIMLQWALVPLIIRGAKGLNQYPN